MQNYIVLTRAGIIGLSEALLVGGCGVMSDAGVKTVQTIKTSGAHGLVYLVVLKRLPLVLTAASHFHHFL